MPRDGSNIYSPPPGTRATTETSIESAKYNGFVDDLTNDLNVARPISAGGTGATTAAAARTALGAMAKAGGAMTGQLSIEAPFAGVFLKAADGSFPFIDFLSNGVSAFSWRFDTTVSNSPDFVLRDKDGNARLTIPQGGPLRVNSDRVQLGSTQTAVHYDGANVGFLSAAGGWLARVNQSGQLWTLEMGDVATRIESRAAAYANGRVPIDAGWIGIGAFVILTNSSGVTQIGGGLAAGSGLGVGSGTYRCMQSAISNGGFGIFQRIA